MSNSRFTTLPSSNVDHTRSSVQYEMFGIPTSLFDLLILWACRPTRKLVCMNKMSIEAYASYQLYPRRITVQEAADLVGLGRTQYTANRDSGKITADQVILAMRELGLNETDALIEMGYLDENSVIESAERREPGFSVATMPRRANQRAAMAASAGGRLRARRVDPGSDL